MKELLDRVAAQAVEIDALKRHIVNLQQSLVKMDAALMELPSSNDPIVNAPGTRLLTASREVDMYIMERQGLTSKSELVKLLMGDLVNDAMTRRCCQFSVAPIVGNTLSLQASMSLRVFI